MYAYMIISPHEQHWRSLCAGYMTQAGVPFYASLVAAGAHLAWQIRAVDLDDRQDCMDKFVSNKWFGAVLFTGIVADKLLQ